MPNVTPAQRIADNVRAELARQSISQVELARRLGWSQPFMSRRLRGRTPFDAAELSQVAEELGVPITALYAEAVA